MDKGSEVGENYMAINIKYNRENHFLITYILV